MAGGVDIAGIYLAGQQAEMNRRRMDALRREAIQRRKDAEAERKAALAKQSETADANKARYAAQWMQARPEDAARAAEWARAQGLDIGSEPVGVTLPGGEQVAAAPVGEMQDPQQVAMALEGQAAGVLGAQKPVTPGAQGLTFEQRLQLAKAGRSQINVGGKQVPTTTVGELSDIDVAIGALNDLEKAYTKKVPAAGIFQQTYSRIAGLLPNTDVQIYDKQAQLAAQKAGLVLEKGKLQASDFPRYLEMLTPRPGESPKTAKDKIRNAVKLLESMRTSQRSALGSSGYRVPDVTGGAAEVDEIDQLWGD